MRFIRFYLGLSIITLAGIRAVAQNFSGGFNFYLPAYDSTAQQFLPDFPAYNILEAQRVTAQGGNFVVGGEPIRFWGVNLVAAGAFPTKDKSAGIAARMRKMGINLVRLHHMDNPSWSGVNSSVIDNSQGTRHLNLVSLDRLDYLLAQLKRNGIYVNMNLNVSRTFQESDGVQGADSIPDFGKGITLFDPWLEFLQREYAQQLLGHVNPYTGLALGKDPVVAMVEMNNENSLYGYWKDDALRPFASGGSLMVRHVRMLDSLWNGWLLQKYGNQATLGGAWNTGLVPPGTGELLQNAGFENGTVGTPWSLELHDVAQAVVTPFGTNAHSGAYCAQLKVNQVTGTDWHIQFKQTSFSLKKDSIYELHFWARADGTKDISATIMRDNAPYNWYTGQTFTLTTQWQEFKISFVAPEDNAGNGRISFSPLQNTGSFWFDDFSLARPSVSGLGSGENLASGTVKRILWSERLDYSNPRVADMAAFYTGVQKKHCDGMRTFLRNNLGVQAPITGANALVGPADAAHQEDMDYLDDHSYWDHPSFPHVAWDSYDWQINNQPMVKDGSFSAISSVFSGLAYQNKPFTVSEYNHPAPNRFRTEMPAAMAAYASFHGADGIMFFDYNDDVAWDADVLNGYFRLDRDNSIMALFPSCAWAYRKGYIQEDPAPLVEAYSEEGVDGLPKKDQGYRWDKYTAYDKRLNLVHSVETESYRSLATTDFSGWPAAASGSFTTTTDETNLDTNLGLLTTHAPGYCALSGFLADAPGAEAGPMKLIQGSDFGSITWVSLVGSALPMAKRSLLTVSSKQQNTGMIWDGTVTVHNNWGMAPTLQNPLTVHLQLGVQADYLRLYPLNTMGHEGNYTTIQPTSPGKFDVLIDQNQSKTLWYGVEAFGSGVTAVQEPYGEMGLEVSPNPVGDGPVTVKWNAVGEARLEVVNMDGQVVFSEVEAEGVQERIISGGLAAGVYVVWYEAEPRTTPQPRTSQLRAGRKLVVLR
jgi:hypothetical protein